LSTVTYLSLVTWSEICKKNPLRAISGLLHAEKHVSPQTALGMITAQPRTANWREGQHALYTRTPTHALYTRTPTHALGIWPRHSAFRPRFLAYHAVL